MAAARDLFNRQATFKVVEVFPVVTFNRLSCGQRVNKPLILLFRQRTVDVVGGALAVARGHVDLAHVDGVRFDDRADGVVKKEMVAAAEAGNLARERVRRKRPGGNNGKAVIFADLGNLASDDGDVWLS